MNRRPARLAAFTAGLGLAAATLAGCSLDTTATASGTGATADTRTVTVLAASSLTDALTDVARTVEGEHPGLRVATSFAASTAVVQQVAAGAPADLVVLAGAGTVQQLPPDTPGLDDVESIATNRLEIAVPAGSTGTVTGLADLAKPDVAVVLCAPAVPCGLAADAVLARAGVAAHVVSREPNVRATLAKVSLREADAAMVYHSDVVAAAGQVAGIPLDPAVNETIAYPMVVLHPERAEVQVVADALRSTAGQASLSAVGFDPP